MALGRIQKQVLDRLKEYGSWKSGVAWNWDTDSNTARILESLVRRGLVTRLKADPWWGDPTYIPRAP